MSKITLEFDQEKERVEFETARDASKYKALIYGIVMFASDRVHPKDSYTIGPREILREIHRLANQKKLPEIADLSQKLMEKYRDDSKS